MVANYTNKYITFNKGQYIEHMEPPIDRMSQTSVNSVITQKMMTRFKLKLSHLLYIASPQKLNDSLDDLSDSFKSQFAKDDTSIGMPNLAKMQIDMGNSDPVLQKPYPIVMKHYDWVQDEITRSWA